MGFSGHNLTCIRGERMVFVDLGFSVEPGNALLLRGPNGSGKSTLLRLAAGFLKPEQGHLAYTRSDGSEDRDVETFREHIHYVGHLDPVKPAFTVFENLEFWSGFEGNPDPKSGAEEALERMALSHIADVPGRYLSAGQRRRLNIARIAAAKKPVWLLDEPSVSLDDASVALLANLIADHRADGGMVIAASHIDLGFESSETLTLAPAQMPEYAL
jgi:heme exporter protein A